jgi:hypothetical protein
LKNVDILKNYNLDIIKGLSIIYSAFSTPGMSCFPVERLCTSTGGFLYISPKRKAGNDKKGNKPKIPAKQLQ